MLSNGEDGKGPERGKKLLRKGKSRRGSSRSSISTNAGKMTPGSHWTNSQESLIAETDDFRESPGEAVAAQLDFIEPAIDTEF